MALNGAPSSTRGPIIDHCDATDDIHTSAYGGVVFTTCVRKLMTGRLDWEDDGGADMGLLALVPCAGCFLTGKGI